ncbi:BTAD domain-containing putative transcriptional regulator [Streptomyces sp. NPDC097619]|uniref:BTAD domain-containing putative transcriptional regulator n=1 Tax=Streptomyces sp. NPDC097619 TaxID=3157228 RepID=UPI0033253941
MFFSVLGPLAVRTDGGEAVAVPEAKVRLLLAALLVHEGRPVSADRLVEGLWSDRLPAHPAGALQTKVSRLRAALGGAEPGAERLVEFHPAGYLLRVGPEDTDSGRFAGLTAAAAGTEDAHARAELLTEALALWRGEVFGGLGDAEFLRGPAGGLEERRLSAVEALAEARLEVGGHPGLVAEPAELAERHPLRERLRVVQLRALYAAGRQAEALTAYEELRGRLAEELGADPGPELVALHRAILDHAPSLGGAPAARGGLPDGLAAPVTALVGRAGALPAVGGLLGAHRLVTLTGPGGVGKSRLAEEVAARVAGGYRDGVRLVGLSGSAEVAEQVGAALGLREEGRGGWEESLRSRRMLLLLDNCEHVVEAAAETVRRVLAAAPGVRVLATSREPLGLPGEAVWTVPSLSQEDAEELFAVRAAAAAPGFVVTGENAEAVATICRRLDRLPLALELAAARVRALGVEELAARLDDRFRLLAGGRRGVPPRQRTLRAVIDWSWELLPAPEMRLLRRLSVFADGCTLEVAEAVCGDRWAEPAPGGSTGRDRGDDRDREGEEEGDGYRGAGIGAEELDVMGALVGLLDRSLIGVSDGPRYRLPESVAAYARERLAEAGEAEPYELRHRAVLTGIAERAAEPLFGPEQQRWLARLDEERTDLGAALERTVHREDAAGALRLALTLVWYWFLRGRLSEARRSLDLALRAPDHSSRDRTGYSTEGKAARGADSLTALRERAALWRAGFAVLAGDDAVAARAGHGGDAPRAAEGASQGGARGAGGGGDVDGPSIGGAFRSGGRRERGRSGSSGTPCSARVRTCRGARLW